MDGADCESWARVVEKGGAALRSMCVSVSVRACAEDPLRPPPLPRPRPPLSCANRRRAAHGRLAACGWELNVMRSHERGSRRKHANRAARRELLSQLPQPAPLFASPLSSGQRQWPQPQHGVAAEISRRLLIALPHRTTLTTREQPPPVPATQRAASQQQKGIRHIDVWRTADCANPWLCGMCERSVR